MEQESLPMLVQEAAALMQKEYAHYSGVEEFSARLGVSKEHLIRSFSAAMGISPGKYLVRIRLENACRYLRGRDYPVELVAGLCGFSGGNYFDKVFRRTYGMTPLQYRARFWDSETEPPAGERATYV